MSKSIDQIEREYAQSQARSEERRNQPPQRSWRDRVVVFTSIVVILVFMGVLITGILIISGTIKR